MTSYASEWESSETAINAGKQSAPQQFVPVLTTHRSEQRGVRKGTCAEGAAFKPADSVCKSVHHRTNTAGIFCDLAKVFDCLNHEIWLAKLHLYGIRAATADWFRPVELTAGRKLKQNRPVQLKMSSLTGVH
jgi:hypothetical protein